MSSKYLAILACLAVLVGCLVPEQFHATINIEKDGTYSMKFEGILIHPMIRMAILKGQPEQRLQREIKKAEAQFTKVAGYQRFTYLGEGRFDVVFEKHGKSNEPLNFPSTDTILSIKQKGNKVYLSVNRPDKEAIKMYKQLQMEINGTLEVTTKGKVIRENAIGKPYFRGLFPGLFGSYSWQIKSPTDSPPEMVIEVVPPRPSAQTKPKAKPKVVPVTPTPTSANDFHGIVNQYYNNVSTPRGSVYPYMKKYFESRGESAQNLGKS